MTGEWQCRHASAGRTLGARTGENLHRWAEDLSHSSKICAGIEGDVGLDSKVGRLIRDVRPGFDPLRSKPCQTIDFSQLLGVGATTSVGRQGKTRLPSGQSTTRGTESRGDATGSRSFPTESGVALALPPERSATQYSGGLPSDEVESPGVRILVRCDPLAAWPGTAPGASGHARPELLRDVASNTRLTGSRAECLRNTRRRHL